MNRVLVTGGAGFIGSHTCLSLIQSGHEIYVVDSYINSSTISLLRVSEILEENKANIANIVLCCSNINNIVYVIANLQYCNSVNIVNSVEY